MRSTIWLVPVLAWAFGTAGAGEPAGPGDALEKLRKSIVQVSFNQINENASKNKRTTIGTVVDPSGLVVFSADPALLPRDVPDDRFDEFKIKLVHEPDQPELSAELLGRDPDLSTAVVRITEKPKEGVGYTAAKLRMSPDPRVGERLFGFGLLPATYQSTASFAEGYLVKVVDKPQHLYVVTSTVSLALFAPVATPDGEVVGFIVQDPLFNRAAFRTAGPGAAPAPVALPAARLTDLLKNPAQKRKRTWIGVSDLQPLSKDVALVMGLPEGQGGVIVGRVLDGMPAALAGLKADDVILKLDEEKVSVKDETELRGFMERLKKLEAGQKVKLTLRRGAKEEIVDLTIGERPKEESEATRFEEKELGLVLRELVYYDLLERDLPNASPGLFVHYVKPGSWPELGGMRPGDIITKVDDAELKGTGQETFDQFKKIVGGLKETKKKEFVFFVSRGKKGQNAAFIKIEADWK